MAAESEAGRHCARCDRPKPAGTHHCHICDRCTPRPGRPPPPPTARRGAARAARVNSGWAVARCDRKIASHVQCPCEPIRLGCRMRGELWDGYDHMIASGG